MKKTARKLVLRRETLHALANAAAAAPGAATLSPRCMSAPCPPFGDGGTGTDTCVICTGGCGTGGACTTGTIPTAFGWTCTC
jgi:hypothetical protein